MNTFQEQENLNISSEGKIFTPKSELLLDILRDIQLHKTALPNFQRPWVWEPDMVRDLIISVAYRYPAGSLLTMPVVGNNGKFAMRPFEGAGPQLKTTPGLMVLDGQQRLTSLFQALYSKKGVTYKGRIYHFYLDIEHLLSDPDGDIEIGDPYFEDALFYVISDKRTGKKVRYDNLLPRYEITTPDQEIENGAMPLYAIFNPNVLEEWKNRFQLSKANNEMSQLLEHQKLWKQLVESWITRIQTYPFPVIELRSDMPLSAICHIFEKVNSTGKPLDVFELATAVLWAQGFELNTRWSTTIGRLKQWFPMQQPLLGTHFLQGLSLLHTLSEKHLNPEVSVSCRRQDLLSLGRGVVDKWWELLVDGYREAAQFMNDQGILSERILPYTTLIVPLATIFAYIKHTKGASSVGSAHQKISQWYWCSVFSARYSSRVETATAQDCDQVLSWIDGGPVPDVVRKFTFRSDALQEITSLRNATYKGVLCLLARNGAKDFGGGGKLSTALFYDTSQDHHHIFPTDALARLKIHDPRANTIVNKTLISSAVNRSIGGRLPSEYVSDWRKRLDVSFDQILASHAISADRLVSDNWDDFVNDRRERLRALIEEACGGSYQPFTNTDEIEVEQEEE